METHEEVERRIRELGHAAKTLLNSPAYALILNTISDYHLAVMVESKPGPSGLERRENAHVMLHALKALHTEVESYVAALDEIEVAQDEADNPEDPE